MCWENQEHRDVPYWKKLEMTHLTKVFLYQPTLGRRNSNSVCLRQWFSLFSTTVLSSTVLRLSRAVIIWKTTYWWNTSPSTCGKSILRYSCATRRMHQSCGSAPTWSVPRLIPWNRTCCNMLEENILSSNCRLMRKTRSDVHCPYPRRSIAHTSPQAIWVPNLCRSLYGLREMLRRFCHLFHSWEICHKQPDRQRTFSGKKSRPPSFQALLIPTWHHIPNLSCTILGGFTLEAKWFMVYRNPLSHSRCNTSMTSINSLRPMFACYVIFK